MNDLVAIPSDGVFHDTSCMIYPNGYSSDKSRWGKAQTDICYRYLSKFILTGGESKTGRIAPFLTKNLDLIREGLDNLEGIGFLPEGIRDDEKLRCDVLYSKDVAPYHRYWILCVYRNLTSAIPYLKAYKSVVDTYDVTWLQAIYHVLSFTGVKNLNHFTIPLLGRRPPTVFKPITQTCAAAGMIAALDMVRHDSDVNGMYMSRVQAHALKVLRGRPLLTETEEYLTKYEKEFMNLSYYAQTYYRNILKVVKAFGRFTTPLDDEVTEAIRAL